MPDHLDTIRATAQTEADRRYPETLFAPENEQLAEAFEAGAMGLASRLTRENIAAAIAGRAWPHLSDMDRETTFEQAHAVLALIVGGGAE